MSSVGQLSVLLMPLPPCSGVRWVPKVSLDCTYLPASLDVGCSRSQGLHCAAMTAKGHLKADLGLAKSKSSLPSLISILPPHGQENVMSHKESFQDFPLFGVHDV